MFPLNPLNLQLCAYNKVEIRAPPADLRISRVIERKIPYSLTPHFTSYGLATRSYTPHREGCMVVSSFDQHSWTVFSTMIETLWLVRRSFAWRINAMYIRSAHVECILQSREKLRIVIFMLYWFIISISISRVNSQKIDKRPPQHPHHIKNATHQLENPQENSKENNMCFEICERSEHTAQTQKHNEPFLFKDNSLGYQNYWTLRSMPK